MARTRGVGLSKALAEFFGPGLHWQGIMATVSAAVVSYGNQREIYLWNKAAERIFDYPEPDYGAELRSISGGTGAVKSMDIMTLRMNMVRMEKKKSFLAQSRSAAAL